MQILPRIGVLGGMGPLATADFLAKLAHATPAKCDQEHFPITVDSTPQIPDRSAALEGRGEDPLPALLAGAARLHAAGCALIAMPCNTAHLWYDRLVAQAALPIVHIADAVDAELGSARRVGLLGTSATIRHRLFPARLGEAREWLQPDSSELECLVMPGIAAVKAGDLPRGRELLVEAAQRLAGRGADVLVLGCTEIPLVLDAGNVAAPLLDATWALARHTIAAAQTLSTVLGTTDFRPFTGAEKHPA